MSYDDIQPFIIRDNEYLFFDIFHKNNQLILICPAYSNDTSYIQHIHISCGSTEISLQSSVMRLTYETTIILFYNFESPEEWNDIDVWFYDLQQTFTLYNMKSTTNQLLSATTLFKNDYKLIDIYYDYYKKQGVDRFYLYYNGPLTDEICSYYQKEHITLLEWDYPFWNELSCTCSPCKHRCPFSHHAQLGQMHHALYKYGKGSSQYMMFNDLDEYCYFQHMSIQDYLTKNKYDIIGFQNCMSITIDKHIPQTFPGKFYSSTTINKYPERSKNIYNVDKIDTLVTHCINYGKPFPDNLHMSVGEGVMYHFANWSKRDRSLNGQHILTTIDSTHKNIRRVIPTITQLEITPEKENEKRRTIPSISQIAPEQSKKREIPRISSPK
jgi:hypothetical protein